MATKGQTIYNPVTHERITFLETTGDTNGERLVFDCRVTPGGTPLPAHVHARQEERFHVISGTLGVMLDGRQYTLYPGQSIVLPARVKHQWWNAGDFEAHFRVEVVPARNLEVILEAAAGMAQAGKLNKRAMPRNPFLLAEFGTVSETYLPGIPIWVQKPMMAMGSIMAQAMGYDPAFSKYRATPALAGVTAAEQAA